jgi:hypothetical protein
MLTRVSFALRWVELKNSLLFAHTDKKIQQEIGART